MSKDESHCRFNNLIEKMALVGKLKHEKWAI